MKGFAMKVWAGMAARKTYVVETVISVVVLALLFSHRLTPVTAAAVLVLASGALGATYRSAMKEHQAEVIAVLGEIATAAAAVAGRQLPAAVQQAEAAFEDGSKLVSEVRVDAAGEKAG
jgi:hypothetical protein